MSHPLWVFRCPQKESRGLQCLRRRVSGWRLPGFSGVYGLFFFLISRYNNTKNAKTAIPLPQCVMCTMSSMLALPCQTKVMASTRLTHKLRRVMLALAVAGLAFDIWIVSVVVIGAIRIGLGEKERIVPVPWKTELYPVLISEEIVIGKPTMRFEIGVSGQHIPPQYRGHSFGLAYRSIRDLWPIRPVVPWAKPDERSGSEGGDHSSEGYFFSKTSGVREIGTLAGWKHVARYDSLNLPGWSLSRILEVNGSLYYRSVRGLFDWGRDIGF